jgi:hypothetical protein
MLEKILKIWENRYLNIISIHILKLEILGCDKSTPLNGISSRDSKKEEARRREINKNIAPEVGRRSSSFVDRCETFNLFLQWLLGSSSEWARWDKSRHKVGRKVEWCLLFFILYQPSVSFMYCPLASWNKERWQGCGRYERETQLGNWCYCRCKTQNTPTLTSKNQHKQYHKTKHHHASTELHQTRHG